MDVANRLIVAVPVKNEQARIGACLAALAAQTQACDRVVLLLNNCTDGTLEVCQKFAATQDLEIVQCALTGALASAGEARRLALDHAQALAGDGIILTTDADATPAPNWIAKNLDTLAAGADAVCGKALICPIEGRLLPRGLHFDDMRAEFLLDLLDEILALVDPDPADPWPRHQHDSGASIAMRAATLRAVGGGPRVSNGEDRALIERFRMIDARIRHDPGILVPVSARLDGRASGGMAATLKRRLAARDVLTDEKIEPMVDAYRRALARAQFRACRGDGAGAAAFAADLLISEATMAACLQMPAFGAAWRLLEAASPVLPRRRVAFADLARETRQAMQLRDLLRCQADAPAAVHAEGAFVA